jgi:hypothetical protein
VSIVPIFGTRDAVCPVVERRVDAFHGIVRDAAVAIERLRRRGDVRPSIQALMIRVSNRGRRDLSVDSVTRIAILRGTRLMRTRKAIRSGPAASRRRGVHLHPRPGGLYPRKPGVAMIRRRRWAIHALHERYRQVEAVVLWPLRRFLNWRDRRDRERPEPEDTDDVLDDL